MKNNNIPFITLGIVMVLLMGGAALAYRAMSGPSVESGVYTGLAQCIRDSGAKFYGAFWCPHCQDQKRLFGDASEFLPYIECSAPDGRSQLNVCAEAGIQGYPTWEFADGKRTSGTISLRSLAELTGCPVPEESAPTQEPAPADVPSEAVEIQ